MIRKSVILIFTVFTLLIITLYSWISNSYQEIYSEQVWIEVTYKLDTEDKLPKEFYEFYENIYPEYFTNNFISNVFSYLNFSESHERNCPCYWLANRVVSDAPRTTHKSFYWRIPLSFTLKLESQFSQRECFNAILNDLDFGKNKIGIKEASKYYFSLPSDSIKPIDFVELSLLLDNPILYQRDDFTDALAKKREARKSLIKRH